MSDIVDKIKQVDITDIVVTLNAVQGVLVTYEKLVALINAGASNDELKELIADAQTRSDDALAALDLAIAEKEAGDE